MELFEQLNSEEQLLVMEIARIVVTDEIKRDKIGEELDMHDEGLVSLRDKLNKLLN